MPDIWLSMSGTLTEGSARAFSSEDAYCNAEHKPDADNHQRHELRGVARWHGASLLLDDLSCLGQHRLRDGEPEGLRGLEVDYEVKLGGPLHW